MDPIQQAQAPGDIIHICGANLRTDHGEGLEIWKDQSQQWEPMELFPTLGDALEASVNPSLLRSLNGFELEGGGGEDLEEQFYSYGWPPTWQSISRWVDDRKARHAPNICPMKDCKQELRRPHALKDHLLFKFEIKDTIPYTMAVNLCNNSPLEVIRPGSSPSDIDQHTGHQDAVVQVNDNRDEVLSDLARLFAGFNLDSATDPTSTKNETSSEEPKCLPETLKLPKSKNYDMFSEIAGASYFIVNGFIYGWDKIGWSMFEVNELCEPLEPPIFCGTGYNQDIVITNVVFQIDENDTLFRQIEPNQWILEPIYHTYGDAFAASSTLTAVHASFPPAEHTLPSTNLNYAGDELFCGSSRPYFVGMATVEDLGNRGQIQPNEPKILQSDGNKKIESNSLSSTGLLGSLYGFGLGFDSSPDLSTIGEMASTNEPDLGLESVKDLLWGEAPDMNPFHACDVNGVDLSTPFLGEGQKAPAKSQDLIGFVHWWDVGEC
ncbi:hypothetical protein RSOLAG22IIIB_13570 [Rhizoctonia solani]|uniref:Uncharacterized protein n=1 Tax=Rhizoctonia solani TaxID=456999 RepID=A0A0K6FNR9_9AGAM|nr:hypothetical protein RSOLAG22IIIB_13570 [Rhizoctonia solani]